MAPPPTPPEEVFIGVRNSLPLSGGVIMSTAAGNGIVHLFASSVTQGGYTTYNTLRVIWAQGIENTHL